MTSYDRELKSNQDGLKTVNSKIVKLLSALMNTHAKAR